MVIMNKYLKKLLSLLLVFLLLFPAFCLAEDYEDYGDFGEEIEEWEDIVEPGDTLRKQLKIRGCEERAELPFQKALLAGELPQTIGGGIGQSRMCVYFLRKAHVGEVQASMWPDEVVKACRNGNIPLL